MIIVTACAVACGAPAPPSAPPVVEAAPSTPVPHPTKPPAGAATGPACRLISSEQAAAVLGGAVDLAQDSDSTCVYRRRGRGPGPLLNLTVSHPVTAAGFVSTARVEGKTVLLKGLGDQAFTTADATSISVLKAGTELDTAIVLATAGTPELLEVTRAAVARL